MFAIDPLILTISQLCVIVLFVSAAIQKLNNIEHFTEIVSEYQLLPENFVKVASYLVILAEVLVVVGIALSINAAWPLAGGMLLFYTAAITINLIKGRREIDCGCSGPAFKQTLSEGLVIRNAVLLCVVIACMQQSTERSLIWLDYFSCGFATIVLVLIYIASNQLLINKKTHE